MASVTVTLVVEKKRNRVVFAEADEDFVDILFSFLTLPLGTVIRLLGKESTVGCVDKLYESVENMDDKYLQTKACKTMLLRPRSQAEKLCEDLKINVDDLKPRRLYICPTFECSKTQRLFSSVSDVRCPCGKAMDKVMEWVKGDNTNIGNGDGSIFVKGGNNRFIISDDLHVTPTFSMEATMSLLQKHGIKDPAEALEKKTLDINRDKILKLLNRLLVSTTPLTDIFLLKLDTMEDLKCQLKDITQIKSEYDSYDSSASIQVNILYDKFSKKVVFAQAGEDLVDMLFSFLTYPLGHIVKLLDSYTSVGSLDNLYKSVELLDINCGVKSEECKKVLLAPKLAAHFGCSNKLMRTEEEPPKNCRLRACEICYREGVTCQHNIDRVPLSPINPKLPNSGTECGGGYAKKSVRFMITDDMAVTPLSPVAGIDAIMKSNALTHNLVEKEVVLGEAEVANLLKACLISRTALTNVFGLKKRTD